MLNSLGYRKQMWTTLHLLGFEQRFDSIAFYQMSGLLARGNPAGRDGVRYAHSKHMGDIECASATFGVLRVSIDRSFHLLVPTSSTTVHSGSYLVSSPPRAESLGGHQCRRSVIDATRHHQPPSDPRKLIGERHRNQLGRFAVEHRRQPR